MEICIVRDLANPFHELHRRSFNVFKHPGILGKKRRCMYCIFNVGANKSCVQEKANAGSSDQDESLYV